MESEVITKENEKSQILFSFTGTNAGRERSVVNCRPAINGERYLTNREVSERLKISCRTLQDYRNEGKITYYQLVGKSFGENNLHAKECALF
jgi:hypothetical protein